MMNEKTINEQYAYIRTLLEEKRLKEALMQLESLLWQCPDWDLRTRLEQLQTSYKYMLEYMKQGALPTSHAYSCWTTLHQNIITKYVVHPNRQIWQNMA